MSDRNVNVQNVQAARAGAGGVRRRGQGGPGPRTVQERGQAYANDVIPQGPVRGASEAGGRGYKATWSRRPRVMRQRFRRCWPSTRRRPGHARPLYIETMQSGLQQREQGHGRQPQRLQPAVSAAGQAAAAGQPCGRGRCPRPRWRLRFGTRPRPTQREPSTPARAKARP
jgi:hypothetical protein